jgi:MFS family permease
LLFGIGRAVPFLVDAVSYAASMTSMLLIRSDFQEPRAHLNTRAPWEGVQWLWQRPFLRMCAILFAASNPVFTGLYLLVVVLAKQHGASAGLVGAMLGIAAAGGLTGAILAPGLGRRLSPRMVLMSETWTFALVIPLLLVAHNALLFGVILAAAELMTPVTNSIVVGFRVALAPDRLQGRVQAASTLISFSAAWLGPLAVGFLVQNAGSRTTILALAGWALLLAVAVTSSRAFRHPPTVETRAPTPATASS